MSHTTVRHDWSQQEVQALFALPFIDLLLRCTARTTSRTPCR